MTEPEAIQLLARWVYELRVDLTLTNAQIRTLQQRNTHLQRRMNGYEFWMRSGLTPTDIYNAARELDPTT